MDRCSLLARPFPDRTTAVQAIASHCLSGRGWALLLAFLLLPLCFTPRLNAEDKGAGPVTPTSPKWPALASGPLQDNSFLLEEAYNQEAGVVQHISNAIFDRRRRTWTGGFTQEWPVFSQRHQLSYTLPFTYGNGVGAARGVGDALINYRLQLFYERGRTPAVAPRVSLILPTGRVADGLGTGSAGVQVSLPVSKQFGPHFAGHFNLGATLLPSARSEGSPGRESLRLWNAGTSVIWEPAHAVNLVTELVTFREAEVTAAGVRYRNQAILLPGIRIGRNSGHGLQSVWGIGMPIGIAGGRRVMGVLVYLSLEHAFTSAARREREW